MKTVEEIQKEIKELELEQAECDYGCYEYDCIDADLQYLYGLLDSKSVNDGAIKHS